jgi:hypothetical protein
MLEQIPIQYEHSYRTGFYHENIDIWEQRPMTHQRQSQG